MGIPLRRCDDMPTPPTRRKCAAVCASLALLAAGCSLGPNATDQAPTPSAIATATEKPLPVGTPSPTLVPHARPPSEQLAGLPRRAFHAGLPFQVDVRGHA